MSTPSAEIASFSEESPTGLDLLQLGLVACVLVFIRGDVLGAEQHTYAKELALHLFAFGAGVACLLGARRLRLDRVDLALALFLVLGLVSLAGATNRWQGLLAFGVTLSAAVAFWCSRALARHGFARHLTLAVAIAVTVAAAAALLEAYGLLPHLSTLNRAPGGTMGNRNRLAHLLALGLPLLVVHALRARDRLRFLAGTAALAVVSATLVLSRCRAAWLAVAAAALLGFLLVPARWDVLRTLGSRRRAAALVVAALAGAVLAVVLPNRLSWRSESPLRDSFRGIADYQTGSGRGRLIQYHNTLGMVRDHPLAGVGPGNWTIEYPHYASPLDPSYEPNALTPTPQFPQGEWLGLAAERGVPALLLLAFVGAVLLARGVGKLRGEGGAETAAGAVSLLCILAALGVVGVFDPVLMTPAAALVAAVSLGALAPDGRTLSLPAVAVRPRLAAAAVLLLGVVPTAASGRQLWAMSLYRGGSSPDRLAQALRVNPEDYRAHLLLAYVQVQMGNCDTALPHIESAHALFPTAPVPDRLREQCRQRTQH